ncbi:ImmA/IrrE family metallo-endopeptidase [uncultured Herbaspirillum sp.]|uniref:ImmA/IrrE family metallo-endopeptidase n=1 Tax=uncultured Herbaspirillum sp. TaxID=160236 RepID=UPI002582BCCB|nr:ImmA/IrrE family metallo-endopeptidase [uncultured Herbaspirillum sp.]
METLKLSVETLEWAAGQVGSSLGEFAQKISSKKAEIIERGELTPPQALKFSQIAGVPFGFLFLENPPTQRKRPLADFRTLSAPAPLSRDFYEVFDDIEYKQSWYRDYLKAENVEPLAFVAKFAKSKASPAAIAAHMRKVLALTDQEIQAQRTSENLFNLIARKSESAGILIFKNGIVGNNTHRALSVGEFRGFVISDSFAPAIFINGADAPAATVFTLAHELAHIWLGESAISDVSSESAHREERLCNQIAAEFLIPTERFNQLWGEAGGGELSRIDHVSNRVKVSRYVVARKALELHLITNKIHSEIYKLMVTNAKKKKADASGGDFYAVLPIRNSRKFSTLVASMAVRGKLSLREAGNLLNTNPNNVITFYGKQ